MAIAPAINLEPHLQKKETTENMQKRTEKPELPGAKTAISFQPHHPAWPLDVNLARESPLAQLGENYSDPQRSLLEVLGSLFMITG